MSGINSNDEVVSIKENFKRDPSFINQIPITITNSKENIIFHNNKEKNIERFLFFEFLSNNTKIEIYLEKLQDYLFWQGLLEYFIWIILLALFISSPSTMKGIWIFFYHNARATIGLFILKHIPKTFTVIENLKDYEGTTLEDIQIQMDSNYVNLISQNEKVLKPLLSCYFLLTIISIVIDIVMFCIYATDFDKTGQEHKEFALLLCLIGFIICDFIYFSFFFAIRYAFHHDVLAPVRKSLLGFFGDIKHGVSSGFSRVANKFRRKPANNVGMNVGTNVGTNYVANVASNVIRNAMKKGVNL